MDSDERERHFNLHTTPEVMAGVYANFATVSHSDYEFTLTFSRVDHEVEADEVPGVVVVARLAVPAGDARADRRHGGQLVQVAAPGRASSASRRSRTARTTRSQRLADPLHRGRVGAEQDRCQRGGSGSPTFWSVIRRSKPTIASGSPVRSSANASARRSTARESWLEIVVSTGEATRQREQRRRGRRCALARQLLAAAGDHEHPERRDEREPQQAVRDVAGSARGRARGRPRAASRPGVKSFSSVS